MAGLGYIYIVAQELLVDIVIRHECSCSTNIGLPGATVIGGALAIGLLR